MCERTHATARITRNANISWICRTVAEGTRAACAAFVRVPASPEIRPDTRGRPVEFPFFFLSRCPVHVNDIAHRLSWMRARTWLATHARVTVMPIKLVGESAYPKLGLIASTTSVDFRFFSTLFFFSVLLCHRFLGWTPIQQKEKCFLWKSLLRMFLIFFIVVLINDI